MPSLFREKIELGKTVYSCSVRQEMGKLFVSVLVTDDPKSCFQKWLCASFKSQLAQPFMSSTKSGSRHSTLGGELTLYILHR